MNKKIKNNILLIITLILYIYMMFFSNIEVGTGKKELENILILAIPCFIFFVDSLGIKTKEGRRKYLHYYLLIYLIAMLGFTFSDNRLFWKNLGDINYVREYNLIPFKSIFEMLTSQLGLRFALYNIFGNFLMLTPLAIILPLISDTFKKMTNFIITIIITTFAVELIQVLTCSGSFDIDDIILNFSGATILYIIAKKSKISKYIYHLFYEFRIKKKLIFYLNIGLFICLLFIYIIYSISIYDNYKANKIDFSNLQCETNEKTFITRIGDSNYYSNCKYKGFIIKGESNVELDDYLKTKPKKEILEQLGITKKKWVLNVDIKYNDNKLKLISDETKSKYYLYGIESIKLLVDYDDGKGQREIIIDDKLPEKDFGSLVEIIETGHIDGGTYAIFSGEYYNQIGCSSEKWNKTTYNYIIPKHYEYSKDFCLKINTLD